MNRISNGGKCKEGFTLVERIPVFFLIVVAVLAVMLLPPLIRARECARRANCASNLRQLGLVMHMYAQDYRENFPGNLSQLYPGYVSELSLFVCPSRGGITEDNIRNNFNICYQYISGMTEEYDDNCLLAFDRKGNHKRQDDHNRAGRNILFLYGAVNWIPEENWEPTWQKHLSCLKASKERIKTK